MTTGELMFWGGIALCGLAIISFIIVKIILCIKGKKLKLTLSKKYDVKI